MFISCFFPPQAELKLKPVVQKLQSGDRHQIHCFSEVAKLIEFIAQHKEQIDCLILVYDSEIFSLFNYCYNQGLLFPVVVIQLDPSASADKKEKYSNYFYHSAEVVIRDSQLELIHFHIEQAIKHFLYLAPRCPLIDRDLTPTGIGQSQSQNDLQWQHRLAEKLQQRLSYLGIYYRRNPEQFFRYLSETEQQNFINDFLAKYKEIILSYFSSDVDVNDAIDRLVNQAFFADVSITKVIEMHMELMDEFSQQLQIEGRSEEILLDYRLTLIDVIANLGEMYRRCIPREDIQGKFFSLK